MLWGQAGGGQRVEAVSEGRHIIPQSEVIRAIFWRIVHVVGAGRRGAAG